MFLPRAGHCAGARTMVGSPNKTKCNIKPSPSALYRGKETTGSVQSSVFREINTLDREGQLAAQKAVISPRK